MDSRTVKYGRMGNVVILIFPDESGAKNFIVKIETQRLLQKMGLDQLSVPPTNTTLKPRVIA